jgi:hypothetical protein
MLGNEEIEEIVFWLSLGLCGKRVLCAFPVMEVTFAEILSFHGVDLDGIRGGKGIVVDPDLVSSQPGIDLVEALIEADIGKVLVHEACDLSHEGGKHQVHLHVADDGQSGIIAILWGLAGLGVYALMIGHGKPCTEGAIEVFEAEGVLCPHFGFKLILCCPKETLNQSSRCRISRGPVSKAGMKPIAGCLEAV